MFFIPRARTKQYFLSSVKHNVTINKNTNKKEDGSEQTVPCETLNLEELKTLMPDFQRAKLQNDGFLSNG